MTTIIDPETLAEIRAIMAKSPAVTDWKMPEDAPTFTDVAHRDEILDYELGKAVRSKWLAVRHKHSDKRLHDQLEPPAVWFETEMRTLRRVLNGEHVLDKGLSSYVLRYQGLSQSWKPEAQP